MPRQLNQRPVKTIISDIITVLIPTLVAIFIISECFKIFSEQKNELVLNTLKNNDIKVKIYSFNRKF
jgi:hypothetical protein